MCPARHAQPLVPATPRGFRDVLSEEAREREAVVSAISSAFASWGYDPVETPIVENAATLEAGTSDGVGRSAFRLFDLDGSLLALRPEMTVPVARVAASRLADTPGPHRIRYATAVFREQASLRGQARQFTQVGIELIGAHGPAADAEVVLLLLAALQAAGLESFVVGMGSAEVLRALLDQAGGSAQWRDAMVLAAQNRNLVEIDRLAHREDLDSAMKTALSELPRIRGGRDAIARCESVAKACGCGEAVSSLAETWGTLEALGQAERVQVDFGIMRSMGYYTGMQLEAYAPGLGLPIAGGGRYDRLLMAFGRPAPAAGFALGLERVMIALSEQGRSPQLEPLDAVLGGAQAEQVFAAAARLRDASWRVRLAPGLTGMALVREADEYGALEALVAEGGSIAKVDRSGCALGPLAEPLPEPPRLSWASREGGSDDRKEAR